IHTLAPDVKIGSGVLDASGAPMAVSCSYNWGPKTREWGDSGITIIVTDAEKIWPGRLSPDDVRQRVEIEAKSGKPGSSEISGIGDGAVFTAEPKSHSATATAYLIKGKGLLLM